MTFHVKIVHIILSASIRSLFNPGLLYITRPCFLSFRKRNIFENVHFSTEHNIHNNILGLMIIQFVYFTTTAHPKNNKIIRF